MAQEKNKNPEEAVSPKLPITSPIRGTVIQWEGRRLSLTLHQGMWRIRSRSKAFPVDISTGTANLTEAKRIVRERLAAMEVKPRAKRSEVTLERVCEVYLTAPKRASTRSVTCNMGALQSVVKVAWGLPLSAVSVSRLPELWPAYVAARQGRVTPDYATRRDVNRAITSRLLCAASVFLEALRPYYKTQGITLPEDATRMLLPARSRKAQAAADDGALLEAWRALRAVDTRLWLAIGLARFAGLRQSEITALRGKWIRQAGPATYIDLRDREEDGYWHKTGQWYAALVLSPELAEYLAAVPAEDLVVTQPFSEWMKRAPQAWMKQFTDSGMPLHRLRGLYADQLKRETEVAMLARAAAIKEASRNLGHTSTRMTEDHYLTPDGQ